MSTFTTTQTTTNTSIRPEIRFEIDYLKTIHGMLKVALLVSEKSKNDSRVQLMKIIKATRFDQRHNDQCCSDLRWLHCLLQLGIRLRMVVHSCNAHLVLDSRTWKVVHFSMASSWNWCHLHRLFTILYCLAYGNLSSRHNTHCCWYLWLHNDGSVRIFRILKIYFLEEWRTSTRLVESINNDNNKSFVSLSSLDKTNVR